MAWQYQYAGEMLRAYRLAFTALKNGKQIKMSWSSEPLDLDGFRREFMQALHRRINLKCPYFNFERGRKYGQMYQIDFKRDQRLLVDISNRVRVYQFNTPEVRARFGRLLSRYDD